MLQILQKQSAPIMTSREVAELTGKDHKHVLRDCKNMFDQLQIRIEGYAQYWTHPQNGSTYYELRLTKDLALCLVAGYSAPLRMKIITRLNELESKSIQAIPDFNDPVAAARAWADAKESEIKAIQYAEAAKPAVAFVERYVQSTGNLGFRQVCKLLKAKENDFRAFLQDNRIMYKLAGDWVPYASHIDSGRFYVTTGTGDNDHNFTSAKFTPKGVEWVAKLWGEK